MKVSEELQKKFDELIQEFDEGPFDTEAVHRLRVDSAILVRKVAALEIELGHHSHDDEHNCLASQILDHSEYFGG